MTRDASPDTWDVGAQRVGDSEVFIRLGETPAATIVWHWCGKADRWLGSSIALHTIVKREPLTITASLACPDECPWHGWVRNGQWVPVPV